MIDLDALLACDPSWPEVAEFFKDGEFCEEKYLVDAIELHLLTEEQRLLMFQNRLSIEKMLNGRYNGEQESTVHDIYRQWNEKLGFCNFGG